MGNSTITKRAIAASFRDLLESKPFEKVTISAIAEHAGINRQTFYYHFHDIYDLISWMIDDETTRILERQEGSYRDSFVALLIVLRDNQTLLRHRMRSADPFIMHRLLRRQASKTVLHVARTSNLSEGTEGETTGIAIDFLAGGLSEVILTWLEAGCPIEPDELISQVEQAFLGMLSYLRNQKVNASPHDAESATNE